MLRIKHFTTLQKMPIFNFWALQYGFGVKKKSCFLARPENNFESKQTYFSYSPNKGFHAPEFQAKLFFTRN